MVCGRAEQRIWVLLIFVALSETCQNGFMKCTTIVYQYILHQYNNAPEEIALAFALKDCTRRILAPVGGIIVSRFGSRRVAIGSSIAIAISIIVTAFTPPLWALYIIFGMIRGFAECMYLLSRVICVQKTFGKNRAKASAIHATFSYTIASFFMPPLIAFIHENYGFFGIFLITGGLVLQLVPGGMLLGLMLEVVHAQTPKEESVKGTSPPRASLPDENTDRYITDGHEQHGNIEQCLEIENKNTLPSNLKAETEIAKLQSNTEPPCGNTDSSHDIQQGKSKGKKWRYYGKLVLHALGIDLMKDKVVCSMCCLMLLFGVMITIYIVLLSQLVYELGLSSDHLVLALAISGGTDALTMLLAGYFLDKRIIRKYRIQVYATVLIVSSFFMVLLPFVNGTISIMIAFLLLNSCMGIILNQIATVTADIAPRDRLTSAISLIGFATGLGSIIGPILGEIVTKYTGTYKTVFIASGVVMGFASSVFLCLSFCWCSNKKANISKKLTLNG